MMNTVWDECVLQARLKYLAFKRSIWLMETLLLAILFLGLLALGLQQPIFWFIIGFQTLRVLSEVANHFELARRFNVQDRFYLYPFL